MTMYIDLLLETGALQFGSFRTKAGRLSPYFLDSGKICHGNAAAKVGEIYAQSFLDAFGDDQSIVLFGPAYKGISLAVLTAYSLAVNHQLNVRYCFNRKEAKDHGEGGVLIGHQMSKGERVVIVEDVLSRGTSLRESVSLIKSYDADPCGLLVGVDRCERGFASMLASEELKANHPNLKFHAVTNIHEILSQLHNQTRMGKVWIDDAQKTAIESYLAEHSV